VGNLFDMVGFMSVVVKVDEKGRILIPKDIRESVGVKEKSYVKVRVEGRRIVIEPLESVADRYYGAFKIDKWPEDLDHFLVETVKKWWLQST